jgi:hypothetical protein
VRLGGAVSAPVIVVPLTAPVIVVPDAISAPGAPALSAYTHVRKFARVAIEWRERY